MKTRILITNILVAILFISGCHSSKKDTISSSDTVENKCLNIKVPQECEYTYSKECSDTLDSIANCQKHSISKEYSKILYDICVDNAIVDYTICDTPFISDLNKDYLKSLIINPPSNCDDLEVLLRSCYKLKLECGGVLDAMINTECINHEEDSVSYGRAIKNYCSIQPCNPERIEPYIKLYDLYLKETDSNSQGLMVDSFCVVVECDATTDECDTDSIMQHGYSLGDSLYRIDELKKETVGDYCITVDQETTCYYTKEEFIRVKSKKSVVNCDSRFCLTESEPQANGL